MQNINTGNLLIGTSTFLISGGLLRSVGNSKSQSLDDCSRAQLRLGLSTSLVYGLYIIIKEIRS